MKHLLCAVAVLGLFFGTLGPARSDVIYWCENGGDIQRAYLDGSGKTRLVRGQSSPGGLSLDLANGTMYWSDKGSGSIRRANLDGSGLTTIVSGVPTPAGTGLDI